MFWIAGEDGQGREVGEPRAFDTRQRAQRAAREWCGDEPASPRVVAVWEAPADKPREVVREVGTYHAEAEGARWYPHKPERDPYADRRRW